ncbi:MAG TPA: SDR family oxidoreductase [Chitinophagaceae bacterium]|nr:SDR family oxidoreductase [Chitinophagaceae bacterium]
MRILVTGGAGFIGSNLVEALLRDERVSLVRVMDNLSTGSIENIREFNTHPKFEFVHADIRSYEDCMECVRDADLVSHQAALGSVPRSVKDPLTTNEVNITGTLNIFNAAREHGIRRVVYAASSSTYGDHPGLPKKEDQIGRPLSPYGVTKYVNELYAGVYQSLFGIEMIGLRYFNIFGPRQSPEGPYAAVIPLFIAAVLENKAPTINGDGSHSRDFTYVDNAVQANISALFTNNAEAVNQVYNIACGEQTSLLELFEHLRRAANSSLRPVHGPERPGDIRHSLADISKAGKLLNYEVKVKVEEGLRRTLEWHREKRLEFRV